MAQHSITALTDKLQDLALRRDVTIRFKHTPESWKTYRQRVWIVTARRNNPDEAWRHKEEPFFTHIDPDLIVALQHVIGQLEREKAAM